MTDRFVPQSEVLTRLGLKSRTTLWRWQHTDPAFPKPIRSYARVVYSERELSEWMERTKSQRNAA